MKTNGKRASGRQNSFDYTPSHIANFFLEKDNHDIDNLKLNKLVYISLGFSLAVLDKDLFEEEVQAWKYGPVIPSLYHEFKHYRYNVIKDYSSFFDYVEGKSWNPEVKNKDKQLNTLLGVVWEIYGVLTSAQLVAKTHQKGSPWEVSYNPNKLGIVIQKKDIKEYYKKLLL